MRRLVDSTCVAFVVASGIAAAAFLLPTAVCSQTALWTVYDTSNSGLPFDGVNALAIDAQGTVWIGTGFWGTLEGGGLAKFDGEHWSVYNTSNSELPHNDHNGLAIDAQGSVWCATEGGLAVFDGESWAVYTTENSGLPHPQVHGRPVFDAEGNAWLPTFGGGLARFDGENWTVYDASNSELPSNSILALAFDAEENLWIGGGGGLARLDGENWTVYTTENSELPGFVWALAFDAQGDLWIGTLTGGLAKFDGEDWTVYNTGNSGLPDDDIFALAFDAEGNLWIGTGYPSRRGRGLARFDGQHWTVYDTSNSGLPDNTVCSLAFDAQGNLWIGTGRGGLAVYRGAYTRPEVISATMTPGSAWVGQPTLLEVTVVLDPPLETIELYRRMVLDLSLLGIPSDLPLEHIGDGRYTASTTITPLRNGHHYLPIIVETVEGEQDPFFSILLDVYPAGDEYLYQDQMGAGWKVKVASAEVDTQASDIVHQGNYSQAINSSGGYVQYTFEDPDGLCTFGYTVLEFWINPGTSSTEKATLALKTAEVGKYLKLGYHLGITLEPNVWREVSISLEDLELADAQLEYIQLRGVEGTFYIDDMRLVAAEVPITAVEEVSEATALPLGYSLAQNVPNPFNPATTIAYDLPQAGDVTLTIYTITGQKVAVLVDGHREAGHHRILFDGSGFGTGVYFYRLEAGGLVETRRMVLLK